MKTRQATTLQPSTLVMLRFDEQIRLGGGVCHWVLPTYQTCGMPAFVPTTFAGSAVFATDNPDEHFVEASAVPVFIHDFHITPEQAGVSLDTRSAPTSSIQAEITQELLPLYLRDNKIIAVAECSILFSNAPIPYPNNHLNSVPSRVPPPSMYLPSARSQLR